MKTAKDILSHKPQSHFNVVAPEDKVAEALNLLSAINRSFLLVMDEGGYKGIFCEHDYFRNVALRGWDSEVVQVQDVMNSNLPMVSLNESVEHIMNLMNAHHARYVPVFSGLHFEGVITLHDLIEMVVTAREEVFDHDYAVAEAWETMPYA